MTTAATGSAVHPGDDKLGVINGLRGLAIIGVVLHHSFFDFFKYGTTAGSWSVGSFVMSSGWLGVNLFFFLSGFVLFLPYANGRRQMRSREDVLSFYRRRFLRLMPLYWLVWVISLVFLSRLQLGDREFYYSAFLYATVLYPFQPGTFYPPGNWVLWSLGLEIWFSVLFPVVVMAVDRFRWRTVLPLGIAAGLAIRVFGQIYTPAGEGQILNFVSDSVLGRLDEFLLGMLAATLFVRRAPVLGAVWFVAGLALMLGAMAIWAGWYWHQVPLAVTPLAVSLLDCGIFLCTLQMLLAPSWLSSLAGNWFLQLLGMMCYSLYVWHGIIQLHFQSSMTNGVIQYLAYLACTTGLAWLTYRHVEFGSVRSWVDLVPPFDHSRLKWAGSFMTSERSRR